MEHEINENLATATAEYEALAASIARAKRDASAEREALIHRARQAGDWSTADLLTLQDIAQRQGPARVARWARQLAGV